MIKAIILDIDGTLTNSQKEISPATKEALMKAQKAGIQGNRKVDEPHV